MDTQKDVAPADAEPEPPRESESEGVTRKAWSERGVELEENGIEEAGYGYGV